MDQYLGVKLDAAVWNPLLASVPWLPVRASGLLVYEVIVVQCGLHNDQVSTGQLGSPLTSLESSDTEVRSGRGLTQIIYCVAVCAATTTVGPVARLIYIKLVA